MLIDGIPLPDPKRPTCANCRFNVANVCRYIGKGNSPYPDDWPGRQITWDASAGHCGQHQYRNDKPKPNSKPRQ